MNNQGQLERIIQLLTQNTAVSICLPQNPSVDSIASATALYLALTKQGKNATLACSGEIPQTMLVAADKIQQNVTSGGNNLVVSFPYTDGSIDKVTYNIEGELFNLVIQSREGYQKLNPSQVKFMYSGAKADVVIVLDAPTLNSLGDLYQTNEDQFRGRDIINIDRHLTNASYGTVNLIEKQSSSTAEIIVNLLQALNIEFDKDIATNLYAGIVAGTNNFTAYSVNANTFEATAFLLKKGAVKKQMAPGGLNTRFTPRPTAGSFGGQQPFQQGGQFAPQQPFEKQVSPAKNVEAKEPRVEEDTGDAPKDWLKPKIFKGSNLI